MAVKFGWVEADDLCAISVIVPWLAECQPIQNLAVSGTVINSATGLPVSRALVILQPGRHQLPEGFDYDKADQSTVEKLTAPDPPQRVLTDEGGRFSFSISDKTDPPELTVKKAGLRSENGGDFDRYVALDRRSNVVVKLTPLAAIHGRVLNENGEPVPGATVETLTISVRNGRRELDEDAYQDTDDLGEYRLWDLTPGLVYLMVFDRFGTATNSAPVVSSGEVFSPIYYPAAATRAEAQPLRIHPGETIQADFVVERHKSYTVRGVLKDASKIASYGRPWVRLLRGDDLVPARASLDLATGAFVVSDVLPGTYTLQVFGRGSTPLVFGESVISVENGDVAGVVVPMGTGVDVPGKIEFPPRREDPGLEPSADSLPMSDPKSAHFAIVQAELNHPERLPAEVEVNTLADVDEAGNFVLKNLLPGDYSIHVQGGYFVASIQSGLTDVLSDRLIVGNTAPQELKIVMSNGGGSLECTVEGVKEGSPAMVAVVRKHGWANLVEVQVVGAEQTARFERLAPGAYTVYAWPASRDVEYESPAALAALSQYSIPVEVKEGSDVMLTVKLAPGEER